MFSRLGKSGAGFVNRIANGAMSYGSSITQVNPETFKAAQELLGTHDALQKDLSTGSDEVRDAKFSAREQSNISKDVAAAQKLGIPYENAKVAREKKYAEEISKARETVKSAGVGGFNR